MAPRTLSMMSSASPSSQCGRRSQLVPSGAVAWRGPGSPQVRTVTFASSPPTGTSGSAGFGIRSSRSSSSSSAAASSASIWSIRAPARVDAGPQVRDLGAVRPGAAADRLADLLRGDVALLLERVRLRLEASPRRVDHERLVDDRGVLALVDRALPDPVGLLPEPLHADAHAVSSAALPASRSRRTTNSRSRLARSQPARGPFGRPRNATYSAQTRPGWSSCAGRPRSEDQLLPLLPGRGPSASARSARAPGTPLLVGELSSVVGKALRIRKRAFGRVRVEPGPDGGEPPLELRASRRRSAAPPSPPRLARDVDARHLDQEREVPERGPESVRGGRDVRRRVEQRVAEDRLEPRRELALDLAPAVAAASRSNSSNRRGIASLPSGSNSIAVSGRLRTNRNRSCSGGTTDPIVCAAAPRPFDVDILRPPMLRNSYGKLIGGSRSNTSRAIASERSREPPAVARSLP